MNEYNTKSATQTLFNVDSHKTRRGEVRKVKGIVVNICLFHVFGVVTGDIRRCVTFCGKFFLIKFFLELFQHKKVFYSLDGAVRPKIDPIDLFLGHILVKKGCFSIFSKFSTHSVGKNPAKITETTFLK